MATRIAKSTKGAKHEHLFAAFPSDPRFEHCACGVSRAVGPSGGNPCVKLWGAGPAGRTCGMCVHLRQRAMGGLHYKCEQRAGLPANKGGLTHSMDTDQRLGWAACGRFVDRERAPAIEPEPGTIEATIKAAVAAAAETQKSEEE